jgi:hypothetical protein
MTGGKRAWTRPGTMTTLIVDTDVVSFLLKGGKRAGLYRPHSQDKTLALSFMMVAELHPWAYVRF